MGQEDVEKALCYLESELGKGKENRDSFHDCVDDCRSYCSSLVKLMGLIETRTLLKKYPMIEKIVRV